MKLRIQGNSIRLRLTQSEVADFSEYGRIEETLSFPGGNQLRYALEASGEVDALAARIDGDRLTVQLPRTSAAGWSESDQVGFEKECRLGEGETLSILVEKDFKCLHKRPEDADAFPHPLAGSEPDG